MVQELGNLDLELFKTLGLSNVNPSNFKDPGMIKRYFVTNTLHDAINVIRYNMNKKYSYFTYSDVKDQGLDSIYVGINKLIEYFIKQVEKLKEDYKNLQLRTWQDESYNVLSNKEKINFANIVFDKVISVLQKYANQKFQSGRVLERLDRDV